MDQPGTSQGEGVHRDVISFNGLDIRIDDLFGKGMRTNTSMEDNLDTMEAAGDGDLAEEFSEMQEYNIALASALERQESLVDVLEKRPPKIKDLLLDKRFRNITEDGFVKKKILQAGTGRKVTPDCRIYFHFAGFCNNNSKVFDSSLSRKPHCINLEPPGDAVAGLRLALKTMEVLEVAQILIHPTYGFLSTGCPPRIPGNATLVYNVKVFSYVPREKLRVAQLSYEDRAKLSWTEIVDAAKDLRRSGNTLMAEQQWRAAIRSYRRATDLLEEYSTQNSEDNVERCQMLSTLYANIGKAYLCVNSPEPCCVACKKGLEFQIKPHVGSLLRIFASAKMMLHSYTDALNLVKNARKHGQIEKCDLLEKEIRDKIEVEKKNEALLAKQMLGLSTEADKPEQKE